MVKEVVNAGTLDDASGIHHGNPVSQTSYHTEVVGDHNDARMGFTLGYAQQIENLGLDGHVEGRRRLVGDDEVRVVRDGHGDDDSLPHATGKLVRKSFGTHLGIRNPHQVEQLDGTRPSVLVGHLRVYLQSFDNLVTDDVHGGQCT